MIVVSLSDMKLISELSHLSEQDMIQIGNDEVMMKYFYQLGMDVYDFPWCYLPNLHRNMQNEVIMGYRAVAEVRCDKAFRDGPLSTITDRLLITSYTDPSLMKEIAELSYKVRDFESYLEDCDSFGGSGEAGFPESQLEPDYRLREAQILQMEQYRDAVRGPIYNASGAMKSAEEYQEWADTRSLYKEKYGS